jgi:hypothetical protein
VDTLIELSGDENYGVKDRAKKSLLTKKEAK